MRGSGKYWYAGEYPPLERYCIKITNNKWYIPRHNTFSDGLNIFTTLNGALKFVKKKYGYGSKDNSLPTHKHTRHGHLQVIDGGQVYRRKA